jgi:CRP-like cAMP-binding protein
MIERLARKLQVRDDLSVDEIDTLRRIAGPLVRYDRRDTIVRRGEHQTASRLLIEGWVARVQTLADGRRQITEVHIEGDFVDLHSFLLKRLEHDLVAFTPCTIANVDHARLREVSETHPHLTRMLWLTTLIDAAIHREWMVAMGRQPAVSQLAHLICELYVRQEIVGLAADHRIQFPLTQEEIADICGLTPVHVNRVLQELRGRGLVRSDSPDLMILDWRGLADLGQFDATYLNVCKEPR